jgi:predicted enzyme related to lactoylglutathione lyase
MNPVVHFEIPSDDQKRISDFYHSAFGWEINQLGPEMHDYALVTTSESDEKGPKERARINGGFYKKKKTVPAQSQCPSLVIGVKDINESMKKVVESGGHILGEVREITGYGKYVSFVDTEGNRLSMMEPNM